jgi:hypothetical protein
MGHSMTNWHGAGCFNLICRVFFNIILKFEEQIKMGKNTFSTDFCEFGQKVLPNPWSENLKDDFQNISEKINEIKDSIIFFVNFLKKGGNLSHIHSLLY